LAIAVVLVLAILLLLFSVAYWKSNRELRSPSYRVQTLFEDGFYPGVEVTLRLFDQPGWRFGALHLHEIDTLNHHRYRQTEARRVCYQQTDQFLGTLLDRADEGTIIAVVSDHGGQYYPKVFDLPAWLYAEGYMTDDPETTRAVAVHEAAANVGAIRLRDPALAAEIKAKLEALQDPLTEKRIIRRVMLREELQPGPALDQMPDLIVDADQEFEVQAYERGYWDKKFRRFTPPPIDDPLYQTKTPYGPPIKVHQDWFVGGHHAREGLIGLWGPPVQALGEVERVSIEDIAPTVMAALDIPLPEDLPGKARLEWFREDFAAARPVKSVQEPVQPASPPETREVLPETLETLRALDYLK